VGYRQREEEEQKENNNKENQKTFLRQADGSN
jgi:hypothetical protein